MKRIFLPIAAMLMFWACGQQTEAPVEETIVEVMEDPLPVAVTDQKYVSDCESSMEAFSQADVDGFTSIMAENIVYQFNTGDSLVGKAAVQEYWQNRFDNVITSIDISGQIWLSVDVMEPQYENVQAGDYVMSWFNVTATYTTGKSMSQSVHTVYHFNTSGKVDRVIQYLDRASIMEASS